MGKNNLWLIIIGVIVLIGLFYLLKPKSAPVTVPNIPVKSFNLVVKDRRLVQGPEVLQVIEGDQVTINITTDEDEELHIHGYDKSVDLEASKAVQLTFTVNLTGRFPYELEKSKTEIGALEVQPK